VLTLGEATTSRALESVRAQTQPVDELVVIDGVTPFHRALNSGAAGVGTPFFVQVDADMVLDPDCFETLRRVMSPGVGIAVGALRDPLGGRIAGVKMFRRECFRDGGLRDRPAPEVDFYTGLARAGWLTRYVVERATLGAHEPACDPDYVFGTYYMLGARYAHRGDVRGLQWRLGQLRRSSHPLAPAARIAIGHGTTGRLTCDAPKPRPPAAAAKLLRELAHGPEAAVSEAELRDLLSLRPPRLVHGFREHGAALRADRLRGSLRVLGEIHSRSSLLAEVALGHGALAV
jgi:hypothetical protein